MPDQPSFLARWRTPLQILCAVAVLAWVLRSIPWGDAVLVRGADARIEVPGRLEGDWKGERVRFVPDAGAEGLPPALAGLPRDAQGAWTLERSADPELPGAIDWRPGMPRVFREMQRGGLLVALSLFVLGQLIVATRWWRLLDAAGVRVSWYAALRWTCLGLFFNQVVPGLTGGDLVKALLVAREHPARKAAALVSIGFDRVLGLLCMVALAAAAVLASGETFAEIRTPVLASALAGTLAVAAVLSRGLRRAIGLDRWLGKLPFGGAVRALDEAVLTYSARPGALALCVALSFLNHLTVIGGILVLGRAFGDTVLPWSSYFAIAPVATIVSALPIAPGGWGLGEAVYSSLFAMLGASAAIGLATSISFRLLQMAISLAAGLFLFTPGSARLDELKELRETPA